MEKQKENIQPLEEEALEQASGGVGVVPDEQEEKKQEALRRSQSAKPRFIG